MLANAVRRMVDITVAVLVLVVGLPLLVAVAVAVRVRLGSPVLFRQRRLGLGGRPFDLVKFRTMRDPAPGREAPEFDTERLPRFGQVLRSTSVDELPSMLNLLRGDITLVGPRPLPEQYWTRYRGDEYERFWVKPGLTGLAQINGRNTVEWDQRLALDVQYVRTRSLRSDLSILIKTIPVVLGRAGVNHTEGVTMHALPTDRP
ncbi:unannotated protein [freshwater metagenome]|uniref:Unannotated protein n=1 Tax=freshwater metagenome TaxID=449393 RepID=A0A6J7CVM8_9ZZZZ|nr:sugar transferase [Actinomycetota bacterium]